MTTSQTEPEFVNAWVDSADQALAPSSLSIYLIYQQWAQRT